MSSLSNEAVISKYLELLSCSGGKLKSLQDTLDYFGVSHVDVEPKGLLRKLERVQNKRRKQSSSYDPNEIFFCGNTGHSSQMESHVPVKKRRLTPFNECTDQVKRQRIRNLRAAVEKTAEDNGVEVVHLLAFLGRTCSYRSCRSISELFAQIEKIDISSEGGKKLTHNI